jgi:hypothetical protein
MIEDLKMALKYTRDARKTKPPCPILTMAALSIYKNLVNDLQKRIDQHEQWLRDELAGDGQPPMD